MFKYMRLRIKVVLGFIFCWTLFYILYIDKRYNQNLTVFVNNDINNIHKHRHIARHKSLLLNSRQQNKSIVVEISPKNYSKRLGKVKNSLKNYSERLGKVENIPKNYSEKLEKVENSLKNYSEKLGKVENSPQNYSKKLGKVENSQKNYSEKLVKSVKHDTSSIYHVLKVTRESSYGPAIGEMGKPVNIERDDLSEEDQRRWDEGWERNSYNQFASDIISVHRSLPDVRWPECRNITYSNLPQVSVVIPFINESFSALVRTVHSVLNRSPAHLLKEIFLCDDASSMEHLGKPLEEYMSKYEIVKIKRLEKRQGLVQARNLGFNHSTAPVVIFMDSHCEVTKGWLEPLLARIQENDTTVVSAIIDGIDATTFEYSVTDQQETGVFTWNFIHEWAKTESSPRTAPIKAATLIGCFIGVSRRFFKQIGMFDEGLLIWGAENLEISFKAWMCHGSIEQIPCSHIGHIYKEGDLPYKQPDNHYLERNVLRLAEVWTGDYKVFLHQLYGKEFVVGWLEPLLARIQENDTTVVSAIIDGIDATTFEYSVTDQQETGVFTWNFIHEWAKTESSPRTAPIKAATLIGCFIGVSRRFFKQIGMFDEGLLIWGAENLEISFKAWMCHGSIEQIPCSHIGHIYKEGDLPYKQPDNHYLERNVLRLAEVWTGDYKVFLHQLYGKEFVHNISIGDISGPVAIRNRLQCKSFDWYLKELYPDIFLPSECHAWGQIRSVMYDGICAELSDASEHFMDYDLTGRDCSTDPDASQIWYMCSNGVRRLRECWTPFYIGTRQAITIDTCNEERIWDEWQYTEDKTIYNRMLQKCLEIKNNTETISMEKCNGNKDQEWNMITGSPPGPLPKWHRQK